MVRAHDHVPRGSPSAPAERGSIEERCWKKSCGYLDQLLRGGSDEEGHDGQKEESAEGERPMELNKYKIN